MREVFEQVQAIFDVFPGNVGEAIRGKSLAGEGGDNGAVDDGLADVVEGKVLFSGGSEVAGEGAEEGIAGAGGVGDLSEGEGGAAEEVEFLAREGEFGGWGALGVFGEEDGAEFAEFDNDVGGAFFEEGVTGDDEVGGLAEIAGLGLIDDEEVDFFKDFMKVVVGDGDPEIHGICRDKGFSAGELLYHLELVDRVHVGKHDDWGAGHFSWDFRGPVFQNIDGDRERIAIVHVFVVFAGP